MKCCIFTQSLQHSPNKTEMKGTKKVSTGPSLNTPLLEMQHLYQGHKPSIMTAAVVCSAICGYSEPTPQILAEIVAAQMELDRAWCSSPTPFSGFKG